MIRVLIVDDQELVRQGMAAILAAQEGFFVAGQAANGKEACAAALELKPDVVLMDIRMPVMDGIAATQQICQQRPQTKVMLLTTFDDEEYIVQGLSNGAAAYILKNTPTDQLTQAIKAVHQGNSWLGQSAMAKVASKLSAMHATPPAVQQHSANLDLFSARELDVLRLLRKAKTNREIAELLHLSEGTVRNHITRILTQIGAKHRTEAAVWAQDHLKDP
jgi:DNA-binding NarL/FixJ family response regulator